MPSWNPGAPLDIGMQWAADVPANAPISTVGAAPVQQFTATATENVDTLWIYIDSLSGSGPLVAEVYVAGNEIPTPSGSTTYPPSGVANNNAWLGSPSGSGNPPSAANMTTPFDSDYNYSMTAGATLDVTFGTGGFSPTYRVYNYQADMFSTGTVGVVSTADGTSTPLGPTGTIAILAGSISNSSGFEQETLTSGHELLPSRDADGWVIASAAEISKFATAPSSGRSLTLVSPGSSALVDQFNLVLSAVLENRVAFGIFTPTSPGWTAIPLKTPSGGTWSKTSGTAYSICVRQPLVPPGYTVPSVSWRGLGGSTLPFNAPTCIASLDGNGCISGLTTPVSDAVQAFRLSYLGTDRAESQSYVAIGALEIWSGQSAYQVVTTTTAASYASIVCLVQTSNGGTDVAPTAPLQVSLTTTGGTVLAGPVSIQPSQVPPASAINPGGFQRFQLSFPAVALAATTNYRILFASSTPGVAPGWLVLLEGGSLLATVTANVYNPSTTFPGVAYQSILGGDTFGTLATQLVAFVAAPSAFSVTVANQPVVNGFGFFASPVPVTAEIPYALITWSPTGLGASFDHYEIHRLDPVTGVWSDIALITTEAISVFADFECRMGLPSAYQMRSVRSDGASSAWTSTQTVTPIAPCGMMYFVTNENPSLNCAFQDVYSNQGSTTIDGGAARAYTFKDASDVVLQTIYGRNYEVAFRPIERRGISFTVTLLLNAVFNPAYDLPPHVASTDLFSPLRNLSTSALSYVCVKNDTGGLWLGSLTVPSGEAVAPGQRYLAVIAVTEVTNVPSTPDSP